MMWQGIWKVFDLHSSTLWNLILYNRIIGEFKWDVKSFSVEYEFIEKEREHVIVSSMDEGGICERLLHFLEVIRRLRAPDGCPWDREQTHESLKSYVIEEAYELLEAIDSGEDRAIEEELGDVLLQIALHCKSLLNVTLFHLKMW